MTLINLGTINKEYKGKDIMARKQIKEEVIKFALQQQTHELMWLKIRKLMLDNNLSHMRLPKQNLEVWFKRGALIFDILNEDAISVDNCCPWCGNGYYDWASILFTHPGINHERHVYACSCGRFYSIYWDKDE